MYFEPIFCPFSTYSRQRSRRGPQVIHPRSEASVEGIRGRLGERSRPDTDTGSGDNMGRRVAAEINCPICIADAAFAVETNCGHIFCGKTVVCH